MASNKPVIHGRDHLPGGADPIPNLDDIVTGSVGGSLTHAEGRYQIADEGGTMDIAGGFGEYINWGFVAGDAVLTLTSPDAPTPVQSGFYIVSATVAVADGATWTSGASLQTHLQFHGTRLKFAWSTAPIYDGDANPGGQIEVTLHGHLRAGTDTIDLMIVNNDSISHTFTVDTIEVSMVYATTP